MASLRESVDKNCRECICDESSPGTWREQTENCKIYSCSFWQHRPLTVHTRRTKELHEKAITIPCVEVT